MNRSRPPKDFEQWQNRDLYEHKILYLFCDGIYLRLRPEDQKAVAVLCAYGIREDGRKVLLHLAVGDKESTVYGKSFFELLKCLATGLEECLTALRFPEPHRKRIRTTNLLERLFGEGRRRSKVIPRFLDEKSGLVCCWWCWSMRLRVGGG